MKKILKVFLGIICMFIGFCSIDSKAKADIYIDDLHIDGTKNIMYDGQKLKEIQYNGVTVWRAGADVTYCIDKGQSDVSFILYGASTLNNKASKSGYEFVGWRKDTAAKADVLNDDIMQGNPETLYAVFRKAVVVNYYNGNATKQSKTDYIYYNNGNITYPKFTFSQSSLNGWTARGWSTSSEGNASVTYSVISNTEIKTDITLYGLYQKSVILSYDGNGASGGSTTSQSGIAYYNSSGNILNPSFNLNNCGFSKNNNIFCGWTQGSTSGTLYQSGASVILSSNTVFYAKWQLSVIAFDYTGGIQLYTVPCNGTYQLEVWGAEGGSSYRGNGGGLGGYAKGNVYLTAETNLYIVVGGAGTKAYGVYDDDDDLIEIRDNSGGYNGGGNCSDGYGSGGGATHIGTFNSTLAEHGNTSGLYIVAGGGGGGSDVVHGGYYNVYKDGGDGGGYSGDAGTGNHGGGGGTQYDGGSSYHYDSDDGNVVTNIAGTGGTFGKGGFATLYGGAGGGGGLYGGGSQADNRGGAGGGSGYVGGVSDVYMENGSRSGNGYAKITIISTN